jgi:NADPH-dependent 7-cyano-7-deazaguanine reductase QueF
MNIFDNLDIINDNEKIKEILEKLIKVLKPANSRVYIKYIK